MSSSCTALSAQLSVWVDHSASCHKQNLARLPLHPPLYNDAAVAEPPASARFVFVGGMHLSGTTVVERLISTHPNATGLRPDLVSFGTPPQLAGCRYSAAKRVCEAPEQEGLFLTRMFAALKPSSRWNASLATPCPFPKGVPRMGFSGIEPNLVWNASYPPGPIDYVRVRRTLWHDWNPFWERDADLFVAKDIPSLTRAFLLQRAFGPQRSREVLVVVRRTVKLEPLDSPSEGDRAPWCSYAPGTAFAAPPAACDAPGALLGRGGAPRLP